MTECRDFRISSVIASWAGYIFVPTVLCAGSSLSTVCYFIVTERVDILVVSVSCVVLTGECLNTLFGTGWLFGYCFFVIVSTCRNGSYICCFRTAWAVLWFWTVIFAGCFNINCVFISKIVAKRIDNACVSITANRACISSFAFSCAGCFLCNFGSVWVRNLFNCLFNSAELLAANCAIGYFFITAFLTAGSSSWVLNNSIACCASFKNFFAAIVANMVGVSCWICVSTVILITTIITSVI